MVARLVLGATKVGAAGLPPTGWQPLQEANNSTSIKGRARAMAVATSWSALGRRCWAGCAGSSTDVLLTRDNNYFNNVYITVALSPGGIISGWYSVVLTALYH